MPPMIPGWLKRTIRKQVTDYLPDTCTIKDRNNTSTATNVPCAIVPEVATGNQATGTVVAQKSTPYLFTVSSDVTLVVGYKVVINSQIYQIIELLDARSPLSFKRARVQRITA